MAQVADEDTLNVLTQLNISDQSGGSATAPTAGLTTIFYDADNSRLGYLNNGGGLKHIPQAHSQLTGVGTNTHTQIDTHIANITTNPHAVDKADVGLSNVNNTLHNFTGTSAPAITDDSSSGYSVGSTWIDTTNDISYILVDSTNGSAVWAVIGKGISGSNEIVVSFTGDNQMYTLVENLGGFVSVGQFIFSGTGAIGIPTGIFVTIRGTGSATYKVLDITNASAQIASATGSINDVWASYTLGSLSNLPSGRAIFELQVQSTNMLNISSLTMEF